MNNRRPLPSILPAPIPEPLGRRKDPFNRIRVRLPVCPVFESHIKSDLFYDPVGILNASGFVYLLKFSKPLRANQPRDKQGRFAGSGREAWYYIGKADTFDALLQRFYIHANRPNSHTAAAIVAAAVKSGATLELKRLWIGYHYTLEKMLKSGGGSYRKYDPCHNPNWKNCPLPYRLVEHKRTSHYEARYTPDPLATVFGV